MQYQSYEELFTKKYKKCKSKKDYKRLCREMLMQFNAVDHIDNNQCKIFSTILGSDTYLEGVALAIKMYILEQQGVSCDILSIEEREDI